MPPMRGQWREDFEDKQRVSAGTSDRFGQGRDELTCNASVSKG